IRKALSSSAGSLSICFAATSLILISAWPGRAADDTAEKPQPAQQASNEELLKKLDAMEKRIRMLEGQLKRKDASATPTATSPPASASPAGTSPTANPAAPGAATPTAPATPAGGEKTAVTKAPPGKASPAAAAATTPDVPGKKPILGLLDSPVAGLTMGAYG